MRLRFLRLARPFAALLIALLMALISLWLFTRNNDFPLNYQPDEQSKAYQIGASEQRRNFNHPLLMLEAANIVRQWFNVPDEHINELVIAGRATSAGLASIGVLALALAGYIAYGYRGLFITGAAMALCPSTLIYAHFFKEDASLAAGVAVALFGAAYVVHTRRLWQQLIGCAVLGVGCAAAASGKYVGVMIVPAGIFTALLGGGVHAADEGYESSVSQRRLGRTFVAGLLRLLVFAIVTVAGVMAINARAFATFWPPTLLPLAVQRIYFSFGHGTTGHYGIALPKPNAYCLKVSFGELMPDMWVFAVVGISWLVVKKQVTRWGVVLGCFLITIAETLAFDAIPFDRYALPLTVVLYFAIAQLIASAIGTLHRRRWLSVLATCICVASIVILQGERCRNFNEQFGDDSRERIREWIPGHLPPGSLVIAERYSGLEEHNRDRFPPAELGVRVLGQDFVADFADSIDQLANRGGDFVVVSSQAYDRFFVPGVVPAPNQPDYLNKHQKFYSDLFARGELVWSSVPSPPTHALVNPELRIYRISQLRTGRLSADDPAALAPLSDQIKQQRTRDHY